MAFSDYFRGKRVLVTGHTGFKGSWLSLWLARLGAEVHGLALAPEPGPCLHAFIRAGTFAHEHLQDIREFDGLREAIAETRPQLIFHLAAQALVQTSYREPLATFTANALGTAHLLDAVRALEMPCDVLVVTSDKCYENREWDFAYRENDPLGGHDVYSMSKAATELVAHSWNHSFFVKNEALGRIVTARAGNVIGGGDFAENRIVPDCARALAAREPVAVRNPHAMRPWQHVLDCLSGYLCLMSRIADEPKDSPLVSPFNFGPATHDFRTVQDLVEEMLKHWPGAWKQTGPVFAGREAGRLRLAIDKATDLLGWQPTWDFAEAVHQTVRWYREHAAGDAAQELRAFTIGQIAEFERAASARRIAWASGA
jgi:CDP-glucose 4,6-dehydratase